VLDLLDPVWHEAVVRSRTATVIVTLAVALLFDHLSRTTAAFIREWPSVFLALRILFCKLEGRGTGCLAIGQNLRVGIRSAQVTVGDLSAGAWTGAVAWNFADGLVQFVDLARAAQIVAYVAAV
jgi:hypothetical protein